MDNYESEAQDMRKLPGIRRARISSIHQALVKAEPLMVDNSLPLAIQPTMGGVNLYEWARLNRKFIEAELLSRGAILFRGFSLNTVDDFDKALHALTDDLLEYSERSSPRSVVGNRIYTSTDFPATQSIFPHNEHSYSKRFPMNLFFFCVTPSESGGETPIADCRKVLRRLSSATKERFIEKKWMYVRNFNDGFGLSWQTAFQTEDKAKVEEYCRSFEIEVEWKEGNRLRTRQIRPAVATHPTTGELVWFNHATFFHVSTLEALTRDALLAELSEEDLPNNTYYGDGSEIEPQVLDELRDAYTQELVSFPWRQGDLLMIDNMLTAHSRASYTGARKILVAMSAPYNRSDI
jgi:alpha-ketoglutarate-dependent taurine dioxygenase